jgi:hypothetical protein
LNFYNPKGNDVKKNELLRGLFATLLLMSPLAGAESQYPAADFEPVIISQDADLIAKHSQAAKERESAKPTVVSPVAGSKPDVAAEPAKTAAEGARESLLSGNYPILAIVLALAGFVFWSTKRSGTQVQPQQAGNHAPAQSQGPAGETGVARYLKNLPPRVAAAETGVAKYLKNLPDSASTARPAAAETGVARYVKGLPESSKPASETGVAKYLKNLA